MTQKFKVGDKVRVIAEHFMYNVGEEVVVREIDGDGDLITVLDQSRCDKGGGRWSIGDSIVIYPSKVKLISQKLTKKQRLSDAEKQLTEHATRIAELEAKVEALEKAQKPTYTMAVDFAKPTPLSANEQRKAIIAEAKAFVKDVTSRNHPNLVSQDLTVGAWFVSQGAAVQTIKAEFIVNADKRTVVALIRDVRGNRKDEVRAKGIAKCAPDDVFNADIGKAIALGRALGLDVERFEQAVKPTEVVPEMVIAKGNRSLVATDKRYHYGKTCKMRSHFALTGNIIDDTNAEY